MSDDGYINLRVVSNVLHGHGPVFNAGERVEASTSPLWIGLLSTARIPLWFMDPAWIAVLLGIGLTLLGIVGAIAGARRWWASLGQPAGLPLGAAVLLALPPMWDYASSGLETGLTFAWIGGTWWATARRLAAAEPLPLHRPLWTPVLVGLGPLVRPDLALFSLAFAAALVATSTVTRRGALQALAAGLVLPGGYQLFRMGYYGLLVPNTALVKSAGRSVWGRGRVYLEEFLDGTLVWIPLVLVVAYVVVRAVGTRPSRSHLVVAAAPVVAGIVHAVYVVRLGGDFMFGRLLLPCTFALLCPLAAAPAPRRLPQWTFVAGTAAVLVLIGTQRRWDPSAWTMVRGGFADERQGWVDMSGDSHPVTLHDFDGAVYLRGPRPRPGQVAKANSTDVVPGRRTVIAAEAIGVLGVSWQETHIADRLSLADPVGSHFPAGENVVEGGLVRPGHEKAVPWAWIVGRFGREPLADPDARTARAALACGDLAELLDAAEDRLTPSRFLRNLVGSVQRTTLVVPPDPDEARAEFCDSG